jgi:hypothetical protein
MRDLKIKGERKRITDIRGYKRERGRDIKREGEGKRARDIKREGEGKRARDAK